MNKNIKLLEDGSVAGTWWLPLLSGPADVFSLVLCAAFM